MKFVCFVALLFVLSFCDAADVECKGGDVVKRDCNTCHCTSTGIYACTEMACYDGPQHPDTVEQTTLAQICTPNETRMEDCNRCRCISNGLLWACTKKGCPPKVKIPVNEPGFTCSPNQAFKDDCNSCTCDASGTLARCTAMACDPNERHKRANDAVVTTPSAKGQTVATPTSSKLPSTPTQSSNVKFPGESSAATQKPVAVPTPMRPAITTTTNKYTSSGTAERFVTKAELEDPSFTCTPSLSFKVECNTCWCAADGKKPRFCTRQACTAKSYPPANQQ